jgi:large subunit GTPase 1
MPFWIGDEVWHSECWYIPSMSRCNIDRLSEEEKLLLTPFERNIEVWRQLWRVVERSHLVVQIVDARNPLRFRCEDLEQYVYDVEGTEGERGTGPGKRKTLLLINKADLLTLEQRYAVLLAVLNRDLTSCRSAWADYFDRQRIQYTFFSAANAVARQEARLGQLENSSEEVIEPDDSTSEGMGSSLDTDSDSDLEYASAMEEDEGDDPRTKVLSVLELEDLFVARAPDLKGAFGYTLEFDF